MDYIDVIIPVFRPDDRLEKLIERLNTQTTIPDKIMLVWTIPEDSDVESESIIAEKYVNENVCINYVKQSEFDHGGTRAWAMEQSDAEYVICMTQDAMPYNELLIETLIEQFDDVKTAAAYARQLPNDKANQTERITREFNYPEEDRIQNLSTLKKYGIKTYFCSDVCAMYKKNLYNEAGGFVKKTIFNEDMLMAAELIRLGYTVKYASKAQVIHSHHYTYMQQFRRNFDLAVSQKQYSEVFSNVPSESEGIRLVITTCKKLITSGRIYLIPDLFIQSAFKYLGFRSGKKYEQYSHKKIMKYTMNRQFWKE